MNLQLKNKTAFITGSTGEIGFSTARVLLQEGATVPRSLKAISLT